MEGDGACWRGNLCARPCHTLRHDGVDYGAYIEQITFLLFPKMAGECGVTLPDGCAWSDLRALSGTALADRHEATLRALGRVGGVLGDICEGLPEKAAEGENGAGQFFN